MAGPKTLTFQARIKPGARHSEIVLDADILRICVKARQVEGRANEEAVKLIAQAFGVPRNSVELVRGARSGHKVFRVTGFKSVPKALEALFSAGK